MISAFSRASFQMKTEVLAEGQSRVIHIRSLPDDVSDKELIQLALPFQDYGKVVNMMMLKVTVRQIHFTRDQPSKTPPASRRSLFSLKTKL